MCPMGGIEFLDEPEDAPGSWPGAVDRPPSRRPGSRLLAAAGALAVIGVAIVVIGHNSDPGRPAPAARSTAGTSAVPPNGPSALPLPEADVFGPQAIDIYATGSRVFALTPTLIGFADRAGGSLTIRPAPIGIADPGRQGRIAPDITHRIIWTVSIGGTAIG